MVFAHIPSSLLLVTVAFAPNFWVAPSFAGFLMQYLSLGTPLFIGATMKISYDILLYFAFRSIKPPKERGKQTSI